MTELEVKENYCWLCPDYKEGMCTQYNSIIRAGRPCGEYLLKWLKDHTDNPLKIEVKPKGSIWLRMKSLFLMGSSAGRGST